MAYQTILKIIKEYLCKGEDDKETEKFCNMYMDMFYELSDELENEVSLKEFEILDSINLTCDSYEIDEEIRQEDKYCIDEFELRRKVNGYLTDLEDEFNKK